MPGGAEVSLVYSLATLSLVGGAFATPRLLRLLSPASLALLACVVCAAGLLLAAQAASLTVLYVGFGIMFGVANGVGYALSIERSGASIRIARDW